MDPSPILHPHQLATSVIFITIFIIQGTTGTRPYVEPPVNGYYRFNCGKKDPNLVLAPGSIWRCSDVNMTLLRDVTSDPIGKSYEDIHENMIQPLAEGCPTCLEDLFICVENSHFLAYCPVPWSVRPINEHHCDYILPCNEYTDISYCPDDGCHLRLEAGALDIIYIKVYNNKEHHLKFVNRQNEWHPLQSGQWAVFDHFVDLRLEYKPRSKSSLLLGYTVLNQSEPRPDLNTWLPSDCYVQEDTPRTQCYSQGAIPPATQPVDVPTPYLFPTTTWPETTEASNSQRSSTDISDSGMVTAAIISGSVIGAIAIIFIIIILVIIIRRGTFGKPNLRALQSHFRKKKVPNTYTTTKLPAGEQYDDVAIYNQHIEPAVQPSQPIYANTDTRADTHSNTDPYATSDRDPHLNTYGGPDTYAQVDIYDNVHGTSRTGVNTDSGMNTNEYMYASVDKVTDAHVAVMGKRIHIEDDEPQVEYATVDLAKKKKNKQEPGIYIVENEEYGTADLRPQALP